MMYFILLTSKIKVLEYTPTVDAWKTVIHLALDCFAFLPGKGFLHGPPLKTVLLQAWRALKGA